MTTLSSFLYEAAASPESAISAGVVATKNQVMGDVSFILLDKEAFEEAITEFVAEGENDLGDWLPGPEAVAAIVGFVDLTAQTDVDLHKVGYSAGLTGYGPLAYQVAMSQTKGWLRSDSSLTAKAAGVWNKMYELSEEGVYKRKFLGDFFDGEEELTLSAKAGSKFFPALMTHSFEEEKQYIAYNEREFLAWLSKNGVEPRDAGWFWAYKLSASSSGYGNLLSQGEEMMDSTSRRLGVPREDLNKFVGKSAWKFFRIKYTEGRRQ